MRNFNHNEFSFGGEYSFERKPFVNPLAAFFEVKSFITVSALPAKLKSNLCEILSKTTMKLSKFDWESSEEDELETASAAQADYFHLVDEIRKGREKKVKRQTKADQLIVTENKKLNLIKSLSLHADRSSQVDKNA